MTMRKKDTYNDCKEISKKRPDETYTQYAERYINWMSEHEEEIKFAVKKNVTWEDDEFWNDIFVDAMVRIHRYVTTNKKEIDNFKMFTFTSIKWAYIAQQNKKRKATNNRVEIATIDREDNIDWREREEYIRNLEAYLQWLFGQIEDNFDDTISQTYLIYYRCKSEKNSISYRKLASIMNVTEGEIARRIKAVKKWVNDNEEILKIKYKKFIDK